MILRPLLLGSCLLAPLTAPAMIVAQYTNFTTNNGATVSSDSSAQSTWLTSDLSDNATGTGAIGAGNQTSANRGVVGGAHGTDNQLALGSNRENAATGGDPNGPDFGNSTWLTFSVTSTGPALDYSGQLATLDTYAFSGIGGTVSADYKFHYSTNSGLSWTQVGGTQAGASISGDGTTGPLAVSFDLSAIGVQAGTVDFLLDPISTGGTNGSAGQRAVYIDNLIVNVVPEPSAALLCGLGGLSLLRRRR